MSLTFLFIFYLLCISTQEPTLYCVNTNKYSSLSYKKMLTNLVGVIW